jgi:3-oxoacyl-[acyl-carrier protein] reductase
MDLGIAGRTAVVCASSKGLGKGCAAALARAGARVIINGRDPVALDATARELATLGGVIVPVAADVGTPAGRAAILAAAGQVDILVNNNAGPPFKDWREIDHAAMVAGVEANMITPIELIKAVIDGMVARGFGRIVNITSSSVKAPISGLDLSSGARAGLTAFLAGVARTVAAKNVTINQIMPGAFDTDRLKSGFERAAKLSGKSVEETAAARASGIPARRFGTIEEFGDLCAFLCSARAGYITGQSILIDGGMVNTTL